MNPVLANLEEFKKARIWHHDFPDNQSSALGVCSSRQDRMYWLYIGLHRTIAPLHTLHPLHKGCKSLRAWGEQRPPGNSINRGKRTR